jgi:serine/threonine-protein kinase
MLKSEEARADAHSVLRRAEALNPDSLDVIRSTGLLNEAEGQYTKALSNYQRILEIDPRNIDALLESAAIYDSQDMSVKAEEYYRKAISLDPNYYKPYEFLGAFYFNEGHYQEAEEQFRKEVERSPGSLEGYGNLGGVLLVEGKYQEAVTTLKSALEIKETSQVLNNIGAAFANLKQDQQSVSFYRRALNLAPQNPLYWMNLGDSERRLNDLSEARQAYIKGRELLFRELRTNPARGFSRALLAYLEARLDDRQRAEQEIEQAQSAWPEDNQVIRYAVLAYEALGKRDRALDAASKGTPQLLDELSRHPDLKELCQDRRFVALKTKKGG